MSFLVLKVKQALDELGNLEEFTQDVGDVTNSASFEHLDEDGLPRVGTHVSEGMLLIGKVGATKSYSKDKRPGAFEAYTLPEEELKERWRELIYDGSFYVPEGVSGVVKDAHLEEEEGRLVAVVEIKLD
jgi:DNA-directed RNA polymerase beta subunit